MEITLKSVGRRTKIKVERDHQWYDVSSKTMLRGRGGELKFRYDRQQKKTIPYLVDQEIWGHTNDYEVLDKWVESKKKEYDIEILSKTVGNFISIKVDDAISDIVMSDLTSSNILFD